jgi:hypothetical protein
MSGAACAMSCDRIASAFAGIGTSFVFCLRRHMQLPHSAARARCKGDITASGPRTTAGVSIP